MKRYSRQTNLENWSSSGQEKLGSSQIVVFGCGGVGCTALPLLAGAGLGEIVLVDGDSVSISNLHRQTLFSEADAGKPKTEVARERLRSLNSEVKLTAHARTIETLADALQIIEQANVVLDATDNFRVRHIISRACSQAALPLVMSSAAGYLSQMFLFGEKFYLVDAIGEDSLEEKNAVPEMPIFGPAASLSGVWGAAQTIKCCLDSATFTPGYFRNFDFAREKFTSGNILR